MKKSCRTFMSDKIYQVKIKINRLKSLQTQKFIYFKKVTDRKVDIKSKIN